MDRRRTGSPAYSRQGSGGSSGSGSGSGSSSPAMSPANHHRSISASGISGIRRTQNLAAKAANARLAQVMASQAAADAAEDEDEDDLLLPAAGSGGTRFALPRPVNGANGSGASYLGRATRSPSPALGRNVVEPAPANRSTSAGRPSLSVRATPLVPPNKTTIRTPSPIPPIEPPVGRPRERRVFPDIGHLNKKEPGDLREASALQDQLDMLEEENYNLQEKLELAEERWKEAEARSRELEKQDNNQVALQGIGGPMTRARTKRMKDALQGLIMEIQDKEAILGVSKATPRIITYLSVQEMKQESLESI